MAPSGSRPVARVFHPLTFGKYYLIDRIGTGGMAEVFRALPIRSPDNPPTTDDLLVIKRILPHIAENEDFVDMFADEAKITAALRHPNVVRVFDFGRVHQDSYIAMEYVDGKDLRNVLRRLAHRERFLDLSLCAAIAHEVCRGLHYAHNLADSAGQPYDVVHRDVSPANVLLGYDGGVKLTDFGVAKASSNVNRTKSGIFKGKFDYMSPEQAEGRDVDARADVFAAGIVLFEMVTCRRLFKADSEIATLQKIRDAKVPAMDQYRPGVAPELEAICRRALSRERDERYPSAEAMADALLEFVTPGTLESARERLAELLDNEFPEERTAEQQRLAAALTQMPVAPRVEESAWDGGTPSTMSGRLVPEPTTLRSAMTGAAVMLVLLVVLGGIGFGVAWLRPGGFTLDGPATDGLTAQPPRLPTGVELVLDPPGRVEIDDVVRGEGRHVVVEGLPPGEHRLRVVAEGYAPHEDKFVVTDGILTPRVIRLTRAHAAAPLPADPTAPVVRFLSTPPGADIVIDGEVVGATPFDWTAGVEGRDYVVELRQPGFLTETRTLPSLSAGAQELAIELEPDNRGDNPLLDPSGTAIGGDDEPAAVVDGSPVPAPRVGPDPTYRGVPDLIEPFDPVPAADPVPSAERSRLSVTLAAVDEAIVYVDGAPLSTRAPFVDVQIEAGAHTIRVVNQDANVDWTATREFVAGETVTLRVDIP